MTELNSELKAELLAIGSVDVDVSQTMCLPCTGCDITPYRDI